MSQPQINFWPIRPSIWHSVLSLLAAITVAGSGSPLFGSQEEVVTQRWVDEIRGSRVLKDSLFQHDESSPLLADDREGFTGLLYYDVDLRFRLTGRLHRYARTRQVRIPDTNGTEMFVDRIGRFEFQFDGNPFWLEVMGSTRDDDMTVYFTDSTNGISTYPAGRYAPVLRERDGAYIIDFNSAYNPYCAYNPSYTCPLPPPQNRLSFHVEAGERLPGPDLAH